MGEPNCGEKEKVTDVSFLEIKKMSESLTSASFFKG